MAPTIRPGWHIIPTEQGAAQVMSMSLLLSLHAHGAPERRPIRQLTFDYYEGICPMQDVTLIVTNPFRLIMSAN